MKCLSCSNILTKWQKKFCSKSCSATYNNGNRAPRSIESRRKTSIAVKKVMGNPLVPEFLGEYTKIYLCTCKISGKKWYSTTVKTIHPDIIESKLQYSYQCRFNFSISEYPEWFTDASDLIKQYGWYSTPGSRKGVRNTNGISRDHLYSVSDGYKNNVDPKLLAHPANCRLLPHTENQRKHSKSIITLNELHERIIHINDVMAG